MKAALATRLLRLETYQKATQELAPKVVFGELALLPRSYAGERHIVRISEARRRLRPVRGASWRRSRG